MAMETGANPRQDMDMFFFPTLEYVGVGSTCFPPLPPGRGPDSEYWCRKADLSVAPIWMMVRMDEDEDKRFSRLDRP